MVDYANTYIRNAGRLASQDDGIVGNLNDGAQYGFSPHLEMLDCATPLVLPPMRPIVTHLPDMFNYMPGFPRFFKNFFERHIHSLDNIDLQYTNDGFPMLALNDGQQPSVPGDTHRQGITPSVTCQEVIGNVCWQSHQYWLINTKNPETSGASMAGLVPPSMPLPPHVFSWWSLDLMCIQYDTTFRPENLISGYFVTSMRPTDTGPAGFHRNVGQSSAPERTFSYTGVIQHNYNTVSIARQIAGLMGIHLPNADYSVPVTRTIPDALLNEGLQREVSAAAAAYTPIGTVLNNT